MSFNDGDRKRKIIKLFRIWSEGKRRRANDGPTAAAQLWGFGLNGKSSENFEITSYFSGF